VNPSLRSLRVHTVELLREPGSERRIDVVVSAVDLDVPTERLATPDVEVDLIARSTVDGITVSGRVGVTWSDECRRCLVPIVAGASVDVDEIYQSEVSGPDASPLGTDALDLSPVVRDAALLALDHPPPLCREDCAGWCPTCGADLGAGPCGCTAERRDERWAALDALRVSGALDAPRVEE
jgi:uncharacterized protein